MCHLLDITLVADFLLPIDQGQTLNPKKSLLGAILQYLFCITLDPVDTTVLTALGSTAHGHHVRSSRWEPAVMSSSSNNKSDFFRDLDELDQLSDDAQSNAADFSALLKTFTSPSNTIKQSHMKDIPPTFTRASTAPPRPIADSRHDKKMRPKTSGDTASKDQDHGMNDNNVMKRSNNSSNLGQRKGSKRRRTEPSRVIPESKQIFKGLTFFFIPNNGVAPARKLRIQRSQEYGALWAQTWSASVTHVIVDRGLNFEEICKVVSSEQLAVSLSLTFCLVLDFLLRECNYRAT